MFDDHLALTPGAKPGGAPIPVAPVVVCVTVAIALPIHILGEDEAVPEVLAGEFPTTNGVTVVQADPMDETVTVYVPGIKPLISFDDELNPPGPDQE